MLRDYQQEAVKGIMEQFKDKQSTLLVMATGAGKSHCFTDVAKQFAPKGRILVIAHTGELIYQAAKHVERTLGEAPDIEMGDEWATSINWLKSRAVISTVQTQNSGMDGKGRMTRFDPNEFSLLIYDECHRATSATYRRLLKHFKTNPAIKVLGVSVGPESIIELKGGCYSSGFVGSIAGAFDLAIASGLSSRKWQDFDVIDFDEVESRGWNGIAFCWKKCKRILRHKGDKSCLQINSQGSNLLVTNDHSIYRANAGAKKRIIQGHSWRYKNMVKIDCPMSQELEVGNILIADNAHDWGTERELPLDMLKFCSKHMPASRIRVKCDVKELPRQTLRAIGLTPKQIYGQRKSGSLSLANYKKLGGSAPTPKRLLVEGSSVAIAPQITLSKWAYWLGIFLGDGWVENGYKSGRIGIAAAIHQSEQVKEASKNLHGVKWSISSSPGKGASVELRMSNIFVAELLRYYLKGATAREKFIPGEWIISWPENARRLLLQGLLDSDGHRSHRPRKRNRHCVVSSSLKLASTLLSLLRSLHITAGVTKRESRDGGTIRGRTIKGGDSYQVSWSGHQERGKNRGHYGNRRKFLHGDYDFSESPIRKLSLAKTPEYVYDLEVEGHPSFVADGILVHNTATPDRTDEEALGQIFESVAFEYDILTAIDNGWLVPIKQLVLYIKSLNFAKIDSKPSGNKDFVGKQLAEQMEYERPLHEVVCGILEHAGDKKTLVFAASVAHAERMTEIFNRPGNKPNSARFVCGKTDANERKNIIEDFRNSKFQYLVNVNVATHGFDVPDIEVVAMARPTKSRCLYSQMLGRGTRTLTGLVDGVEPAAERKRLIAESGKPALEVIDFVGNVGRHKLVHTADVLSGNYTDDIIERAERNIRKSTSPVNTLNELQRAERELARERKARLEAEPRQKIVAHAKFHAVRVDPFDALDITPWRERAWHKGRQPTPKMLKVLDDYGYKTDGLSYTHASQAIEKIFALRDEGPPTPNQRKFLRWKGVNPDNKTFKEASDIIGRIKQGTERKKV